MLTAKQEQALARMQLDSVMNDFQLMRSQLTQARKELAIAQTAAMHALGTALAKRIPGQGLRQKRIATIAVSIARQSGCPASECRDIGLVAPLYNLGLLAMNDESIAEADSTLSSVREQIQRGIELAGKDTPLQRLACDVIHHHREHWDGSGRPDGLRHEQIPFAARIVAVAETYDRMLHGRSELGKQQSRATFAQMSGREFDPRLVTAALESESRIAAVTSYLSQRGNTHSPQPEVELMSVLL